MTASPEWYEDESLWEAVFEFLFPESRIAAASEEARQALALAGASPPLRVLDLGCGAGRHSVALAGLGCEVTGVDRTAYLLEKARAAAAREGVEVEWVERDMREFSRPEAFDLAVSLFTSFGYFAEEAENQLVLENLHDCLVPGGTLVLDLMGKENLAKIFEPTGSQESDDGLIVMRRHVVADWSRIANEWIVIRDGQARSFSFEFWVYSARELSEMLRRAGFREIRLHGDLGGSPYDTEASRLVAVATR